MRIGPIPHRLFETFGLLVGIAFAGCSGGGTGPAGPGPVASRDGGVTVNYQGQVLDQMTRAGIAGVRVVSGGISTVTDASGHFALSVGEGVAVTLSGGGYYDRVTTAEGSVAALSVVPRTFDMSAFNDVARDYSSGTVRWMASPDVYVDSRAHGFDGPVPGEWIEQVKALASGFVSDWSGGRLSARSVTVGNAPPAAGTPGTIVISFDEDPSRYPSASAAGVAVASWDATGTIRSATIRLRFSGLLGSAAAFSRQAVLGHEIGHALGLAHMDGSTASMMAPVVRTPELTAFDAAAGALLYDRLPGTQADDREPGTGGRSALAPASGSRSAACGVELANL